MSDFVADKEQPRISGDFLVAHFVLPAEQDRGALVFRQFGERLLDFFCEFAVQDIFRGQENFFVLVLPRRLVVVFGVRFLERFGGMARAPADFVQAQIARDGEKPGGKFGGAPVAGAGFPDLEKRILRHVLGLGLVAERAKNEVEQRLLVFPGQSRKRRAVAAFHTQHQHGIRIGLVGHCRGKVYPTPRRRQGFAGGGAFQNINFCARAGPVKKIEAAAEARLTFSPNATPAEKLARYKNFLKVESHRLKLLHRAGADGLEICQARAAILDALLRHLWDTAKKNLSAQAQKEFPPLALVAIGGFGRAELNPHSDIDFMFCTTARWRGQAAAVSRQAD